MKRRLWFTLAVTLQIAVLLIMIGSRWFLLAHGTKILLQTVPVDPWDLFRGDYVILNYEISELDLGIIASGSEEYRSNDTVFVALVPEGKHMAAAAVSHRQPDDGSLFMQGTVRHYSSYDNKLYVSYGIESYFVPQHQGRDIERADPAALDVEVSVDDRGKSALSRLFIDGREVIFQ